MASTITSIKHEHVARVRELGARSARQERGRCVIAGAALIQQAIETGLRPEFLLTDVARGSESPAAAAAQLGREAGVAVWQASGSVLRHALRSTKPVDAVAVAPLPAENDPGVEPGDFVLVLDGVNDPGNLGTIARTARALGVSDLVCTDSSTDLTSRKVLDASRCAVLRCAVRRYDTPTEAVRALRVAGFEIVATSPRATEPQTRVRLGGGPLALVLGGETAGVAAGVFAESDHVVGIPMAGDVESLNVAVAAGLSIEALRRQQRLARTPTLTAHERATLRDLLAKLD